MKEIVIFDTNQPEVKINHRDLGMSLDEYIAGSVRCGFCEIPAKVISYNIKGGKLLRILIDDEKTSKNGSKRPKNPAEMWDKYSEERY